MFVNLSLVVFFIYNLIKLYKQAIQVSTRAPEARGVHRFSYPLVKFLSEAQSPSETLEQVCMLRWRLQASTSQPELVSSLFDLCYQNGPST